MLFVGRTQRRDLLLRMRDLVGERPQVLGTLEPMLAWLWRLLVVVARERGHDKFGGHGRL